MNRDARDSGKRDSMDVSGVRFVSTYQTVWNGPTQEFTEYKEELEDMMMSSNRLVIGGL